MEVYKEMNDDALQILLYELNEWWKHEEVPVEYLRARVVLIFKKGDTNNLGNYRPISLLNSMYKIFTAIIQRRLADTIDPHL